MQNIKLSFLKFFRRSCFDAKKRPDIKVELSFIFKLLNWINLIIIGVLCANTILIFDKLPSEIPVHFTWDGSVDYWSSKYFLLLEIAILIFIVGFLTYIDRFYTQYNYPVEITIENALFQYSLALKFFTIMKTLNVILFSYIYYVMLVGSFDKEKANLDSFFWIIVLLICSSTFIYRKIATLNYFKNKPKKE